MLRYPSGGSRRVLCISVRSGNLDWARLAAIGRLFPGSAGTRTGMPCSAVHQRQKKRRMSKEVISSTIADRLKKH